MTIELPIACSLDEDQLPARIEAWGGLLATARISAQTVLGGVRLVLRSSPETSHRLGELIVLESQCCAWMAFEVSDGDVITVDITAQDDFGRRAIRELFQTEPTG